MTHRHPLFGNRGMHGTPAGRASGQQLCGRLFGLLNGGKGLTGKLLIEAIVACPVLGDFPLQAVLFFLVQSGRVVDQGPGGLLEKGDIKRLAWYVDTELLPDAAIDSSDSQASGVSHACIFNAPHKANRTANRPSHDIPAWRIC